ncbi:MAG: Rrf2 family transcriptional regulator [Bryobacteraceae bacterium]
MISKTTILAVRTLMHIGKHKGNAVHSPRQVAEVLKESPTYLAKVTRQLVKSGILRAEKGAHGGVYLGRAAGDITLLEIVEACQGAIVGDYCRPECDKRLTCSYHVAAQELRDAIVSVLSQWTLERLMERPSSNRVGHLTGLICLMAGGQPQAASAR